MKKFFQKIWISILEWDRIPLIAFLLILSLLWFFGLKVKSVVFLLPSLVICLFLYFIPRLFKIIRILCLVFIIMALAIFYLLSLLVVQDTVIGFLAVMSVYLILLTWWDYQRKKYNLSSLHHFWKTAILVLGVLFFIALGITEILGYRAIGKVTEKAKELQLPLDLQGLKKASGQEKIQAEKNSGPIIVSCGQMLTDAYQKWLQEMADSKPDSVWKAIQSSVKTKKGIHEIPENRTLAPTEWEDLKKFLDSMEKIHKMLLEALSFEQLQIPLEFPMSEIGLMEMRIGHLSDIRNCMRYLSLHADYYCETKQQKEFVSTLDSMIKIANISSQEPFLLANMIQVALQKNVLKKMEKGLKIFSGSLQEESLINFQKQITPWCDFTKNSLSNAGVSEFIWAYHTAQKPRWDFLMNKEGIDGFGFFLPNAYLLLAPTGWTKLDLAYLMTQQIQKIETAKDEKTVRAALSKREEETSYVYPLTRLIMPVWHRIYEKNFEALTLARCTWLALETTISVKQHKDASSTLETLFQNGLIYTIDPFTGQKLSYKRQENSYFIHGTAKASKIEGKEESYLGIEIAL